MPRFLAVYTMKTERPRPLSQLTQTGAGRDRHPGVKAVGGLGGEERRIVTRSWRHGRQDDARDKRRCLRSREPLLRLSSLKPRPSRPPPVSLKTIRISLSSRRRRGHHALPHRTPFLALRLSRRPPLRAVIIVIVPPIAGTAIGHDPVQRASQFAPITVVRPSLGGTDERCRSRWWCFASWWARKPWLPWIVLAVGRFAIAAPVLTLALLRISIPRTTPHGNSVGRGPLNVRLEDSNRTLTRAFYASAVPMRWDGCRPPLTASQCANVVVR